MSVKAGRPGSVGDSYTYRHSELYKRIKQGEWLGHTHQMIKGVACGTCPFALEWLPKVGDFVPNKFAFSLLCVSEMANNDI